MSIKVWGSHARQRTYVTSTAGTSHGRLVAAVWRDSRGRSLRQVRAAAHVINNIGFDLSGDEQRYETSAWRRNDAGPTSATLVQHRSAVGPLRGAPNSCLRLNQDQAAVFFTIFQPSRHSDKKTKVLSSRKTVPLYRPQCTDIATCRPTCALFCVYTAQIVSCCQQIWLIFNRL